jgi:uncharacterized repeat protein (TIGR03803 family)
MRTGKSSLKLKLAIIAAAAIISATATAQTEKVLYSFQNNNRDGYNPYTGVIFDAAGNLYGTAGDGGSNHDCAPEAGCGTVFALIKNASGGWTEQTIHEFDFNGTDGFFPVGNTFMDAAGNLYGTTAQGGNGGFIGDGTVYELMPAPSGWTEKILHNFGNPPDGNGPRGGVIMDATGNLYGTTVTGGPEADHLMGTVFELSHQSTGDWTEKILYDFRAGADGFNPYAGLVMDGAGNLYGTTEYGGAGICNGHCGVVFELSPQSDGTWSEKVVHYFNNAETDGYHPVSGLIFDAAGNLYGTTPYGGTGCSNLGCGVVYELMPQSGGLWNERIVHYFDDNGTDGYYPGVENLLMDGAGNLYGTTLQGGTGQSGILYKLAPQPDGSWAETTVREFGQVGFFADGFGAEGTLVMDASGNLYGTALAGGFNECIDGCGLVFEITP